MADQSILHNWKLRILLAIVIGSVAKFSADVIYQLIYTRYPLWQPVGAYISVIVIALIIIEVFLRIENKLNAKLNWKKNRRLRFWCQLIFQGTVALVITAIFRAIFLFFIFNDNLVVFSDEAIIISGVLTITIFYNLISYWFFVFNQWRFSLAEIERFKKENAEFQFDMLRSQVNPHFLFNSLNTLSSLMYENVDIAADYIRKLSQVYRYVLENRQVEMIPLENEIEFINSYKYLFELRFKDRLHIHINIEPKDTNKMIVPMTIQMLVENAVKHNVISQKHPLQIDVFSEDGWLKVKNSLKKKTPEGYSAGMGLMNIKSRYGFVSEKKIQIIETAENFEVIVPLIEKIVE
ncbi:MAG: histidine kinase [Salinivirgaceae bacterium]|nr:histidine kinase [Salinivirgaceae bacterium]